MSSPTGRLGHTVDTRTRILVVVIANLIGIIAGVGAALLVLADGKSAPQAILYGGGTYAGTVALILLMVTHVQGSDR